MLLSSRSKNLLRHNPCLCGLQVACKMLTMTLFGPCMYLFNHWASDFTVQKDSKTERVKKKDEKFAWQLHCITSNHCNRITDIMGC